MSSLTELSLEPEVRVHTLPFECSNLSLFWQGCAPYQSLLFVDNLADQVAKVLDLFG
jgi:hypothetical protein